MIISLHKEYLVCPYMLTSEYLHTHFRLVILSIVLSQALRKMIVCVHLPQKQFLIFTFLASCLTTEDLTAMMGMATETLYNKDDCVIKEGSSNQHLFFIAEGCKLFYIECLQPLGSCRAEIIAPEDDTTIVLGQLRKHESFGEIGYSIVTFKCILIVGVSFLKKCSATASVKANENKTKILVCLFNFIYSVSTR